jgi:hypothetical protein
MPRLSLEESRVLVKGSGTRIRMKPVKAYEYVWRCKFPRCPKSKLSGAIRGTVSNWVLLLAAQHLQGHETRKAKIAAQKKLDDGILEV